MIHYLKTKELYFQDVWNGHKQFEIRNDDRGFKVDDILILGEGISTRQAPRIVVARVTSITYPGDSIGLLSGYVALGIKLLLKIANNRLTELEGCFNAPLSAILYPPENDIPF